MQRNLIAVAVLFSFVAMAMGKEVPYREMRALWDMSGFALENLGDSKTPWLILKTTPDADSGITSGLYINVDTGQAVREPGKNIEVVTKGTLQQLTRFDGKNISRDQQTYSWGSPVMTKTRDVRRLLYSPFVSGGTILSHFWGAARQETAFDPCYMVPEEWTGGMFSSFLDLRRAEGGRWTKIENKEDRQRVTQQLAGENPIVALHAFRLLRVLDRLKDDGQDYVPPKPSELVGSAQLKNRSLLITELLRQTPSLPTVGSELKKLAAGAVNLEQLRPLAVAARAVLDFGGGSEVDESKRVSRDIINQCMESMKKFHGDGKLNDELQKIINHNV